MGIERKKKSSNGSVWSIFMHADTQDWLLMGFGVLGSIGEGSTTPLVLYLSSLIMNNIGTSSTISSTTFVHCINKNAVAWLYLAAGTFLVCFLEGYCWTRTSERQAARMRAKYLKAVMRQEVAYFDLNVTSTSDIITGVSNDSLLIQDVISEKVPNLLMNFSLFIGSYIAGFAMLWRLAIVGIPFTVLLVIPGFIYGKTLMGLAKKMREEYNKAGAIAEQAICSIRTVYSYVGENKTINAFSNALQGSLSLGIKQGLAKGLAIGSNNGIVFGIWSFLCYYGSRLVMDHGAKGGTVFSAGAAITVGGLALGAGLTNMKYLSEASSAAERIREVNERVPMIDSDDSDGEILGSVRGEVEFRNVEFAYPTRPETVILKGLWLKIPAGKTVALVGESGSGKSTIIALLQRFYDPLGGEIRFDGVAIDKLQLKWFRSQMGLVSQEPVLFATSIKENILFGKEDATEAEVIEAAKASNAHNFISMLPQGYQTQVGERGTQMSGGQKQRIAIARAIIKKPRMLLLDEATSALDSHSERIVQKALEQVAVGCTTIVVAHRLSTIRNADVIVAMRAGKVVEMGTHDDLLLNHDGLYSSMVRLQQTENSETDESVTAPTTTIHVPSSMSASDTADIHHLCLIHTDDDDNIEKVEEEKEENKNAQATASFWRLLALNLPEWKQAVMGCLNAMVFGAVQPVYTLIMGSMMFVYFDSDDEEIKRKTKEYSVCFVGLFVLSLIVNIGQHYSFAYMGECLTKRIRETMFKKILTFEVSWFDLSENSTGAICSRLANDANVVRSLVGDRIGLVVQTASAVVTAWTLGLVIAWRLAIVMICVQPLMIACFYTKRVLIKTMSKKVAKAQEESSKVAAEAVSNLRTITAFSSQNRILKMLENAQEGPRRENIRQSFYAGIGLACSQGITSCVWALNYWYGGKLVADGYITTKALFQSFMIIVSTARVIADAGSMTSDLAKGADAVCSIFAVLDRTTKIAADDENGHNPEHVTGQIQLHDVHFAYPTRPNVTIFKSFSMKIEAGKSTALIGQSGSGKSTIIGLIARFYDPLRGYVTIDNRDVKSYNLKQLRRHIALVSQEPTLFNGSIRENIAYGSNNGDDDNEVDESEIIEASKLAMAHDFITGLKDGYDTWCGEKGLQLSGGQKQRIAIARAILKNPRVLLLDEATNALDIQSEKVVQEALERAMVERTSVIVAHRMCTIKKCDLIAVLEKGMVVESGTHSSLLAKGTAGAYCNFVRLQTGTN
ncbi:hypothetical protein S83_012781 [Arachis hypogaea]